MEYNKNFSLYDAYDFLSKKGLAHESSEIKNSPDKFKSYTSTLRRAKIIVLVRDKKLLDDFRNSVWPSGLTAKGKSRIRFFENLVDRFIADQEGTASEDEEDEMAIEENAFAYENELRNYLAKNLSVIEKGLRIYESPSGITGEEFVIPETSRRIDILANDNKNNFVVIELKVSRGYEKVIGQILYYQSMIKMHFKQDMVRAIIIAQEITPELKTATLYLPDIELFEYQLSLTLNRIK